MIKKNIMSYTITEKLQIIKNSTNAIKEAFINKGGYINGDITTWANAINEMKIDNYIEQELIFTGMKNDSNINGYLNYLPYENTIIQGIYFYDNELIIGNKQILTNIDTLIELTPVVTNSNIIGIFVYDMDNEFNSFKSVKFIQQ